jgi:hypothetical protein
MKKLATFFLLLVFPALSCLAASTSGISGTIRDSEGAVIANARVLIHWDPAGAKVGLSDNIGIESDITVATNADGEYTASVPPGFYDVFVSSTAFSPAAAKIRVKRDKPGTYSPRLKVDPLVSRELD